MMLTDTRRGEPCRWKGKPSRQVRTLSVTRAPLEVFSFACVALILAGLIELTRRRWWADLGKLAAAAVSVELVIVLVDVVMGARVGAHLDGDTRVHLARIRMLLDHGFNNYDPFIAGGFFFPMVLLAVVWHDSFYALNPILIGRSILRTLLPYCGMVLLFCAGALLFAGIGLRPYVMRRAPTPVFLLRLVQLYMIFVAVGVLGRFYQRHQDRLDWAA